MSLIKTFAWATPSSILALTKSNRISLALEQVKVGMLLGRVGPGFGEPKLNINYVSVIET
jgi:hypothetical protein